MNTNSKQTRVVQGFPLEHCSVAMINFIHFIRQWLIGVYTLVLLTCTSTLKSYQELQLHELLRREL